MFSKAGALADAFVRRWMPDPFVLVLLLTLLALSLGYVTMGSFGAGAALAPGARAGLLIDRWVEGFGNPEILKFGLQIILIIVTGEAIASSPPAKRLLAKWVDWPKSPFGALMLVTSFAIVTGWLHWGFGLIASALLAREVGRSAQARGLRIHYPLLGIGAYTSMLLWHAGLTASAPLLMNTEKNFVSDVLGLSGPDARVPLSETVLAPYNLVVCGVLALVVPPLVAAMHPRADSKAIMEAGSFDLPEAEREDPEARDRNAKTPAERMDSARWISFAIGAVGLVFMVRYFRASGLDLNHNVVNALFLMLGMVLHPSATSYARSISKSVRGTGGIVLQFPFYGGILAVMTVSGLSERIAHVFVTASSASTLPFFTYLASIITKSFVPSGAGEWAVEGPVMLKAAQSLGVSYGKVTMGVAYGNMLGNMYQPFWSLPLLALMGLRARDIMGYGLILFVVCFPVLAAALLLGG